MAICITKANYIHSNHGSEPGYFTCSILADTEADITGLGAIVKDGRIAVKPYPGSVAMTADGAHKYILSPSGAWTKVGG